MSQSNIYESNWINLVFENRNKEYGAYQLRQENTKTSLLALLVSVSICSVLFVAPKVFNLFENNPPVIEQIPDKITDPIEVVNVNLQDPPKAIPLKSEAQTQQVVTEKMEVKSLTNPVIVHSNEVVKEIPTNESVKNSVSIDPNAVVGTQATLGTGATTTVGVPGTVSKDYGDQVVTTTILDKQPSFPGGMDKFYNYIGRNFETPEINEDKTIRFFVSFIVEKDGSMTNINVKTDPGYSLSKEAIRVFQSLKTKWVPGMIDSKPVRTAYNLPITVQMN
ncbi:MAG: periplasmic protein TonB [Bacteroidota bacterium]|nr:periplasmic protein TonB [Bacteroidota bacterium]